MPGTFAGPRLYLARIVPHYHKPIPPGFPRAAAPLKLLIMISSPEDPPLPGGTRQSNRLSYEEEEKMILDRG